MSDEVLAHVAAQSGNGRRMEVSTIKEIARLIKHEPCSALGKEVLQDRLLLDEPVGRRVRFRRTISPSRQLSGTALTGCQLNPNRRFVLFH